MLAEAAEEAVPAARLLLLPVAAVRRRERELQAAEPPPGAGGGGGDPPLPPPPPLWPWEWSGRLPEPGFSPGAAARGAEGRDKIGSSGLDMLPLFPPFRGSLRQDVSERHRREAKGEAENGRTQAGDSRRGVPRSLRQPPPGSVSSAPRPRRVLTFPFPL